MSLLNVRSFLLLFILPSSNGMSRAVILDLALTVALSDCNGKFTPCLESLLTPSQIVSGSGRDQ